MFEQQKLMFMYAITPVHMGAGQAIGVIDNPIQRERHTLHPNMAGSGIKGAIRHHVNCVWDKDLINRLFGPEENPDFAGAISFSDGQLVAFPVRSLKQSYVYAVSPVTLARLKRLANICKIKSDWNIPKLNADNALVCDQRVLNNDQLILEAFEYKAEESEDLKAIAHWLADNALPGDNGHDYFREKLRADLVLLPETAFSYFVENATIVEAHVKIHDVTGVAKDGGLFYSENLPPESLLIAPVFTSQERSAKGQLDATEVMLKVTNGLNNNLVQFGGDSTTGRGQIILHFAAQGE